ncbi:MAG: hypothetical protein KOO60_02320 [Gemmatimonadales bacterium]|nr:hypothetical protein [Gemmatimonadales bacterium]
MDFAFSKQPVSYRDLLVLLFLFYFSFFLGSMLGRFLLFPFSLVFTSLVTHVCSSLLGNALLI